MKHSLSAFTLFFYHFFMTITRQIPKLIVMWFKHSPSQPRSTWPTLWRASAIRSGSLPFKSTEARQPWYPSRDAMSLGRLLYMFFVTPPIYSSPANIGKKQTFRYVEIATICSRGKKAVLCKYLFIYIFIIKLKAIWTLARSFSGF